MIRTMSTESGEREREGTFPHTGLSLTGAAVLFLALRLFAVTGYDWHTAFAVAETLGIDDAATIVVGSLMAEPVAAGAAVALTAALAIVHQWRMRREGQAHLGRLALLVAVVVFGAALVVSYGMWWVPACTALIAAVLALLLHLRRRDRWRRVAGWIVARTGAVVVLAILIMAATVRTPWVPLERIETDEGTVYGYVLDTSPGFLKVLDEEHHRLEILVSTDVTSRVELE